MTSSPLGGELVEREREREGGLREIFWKKIVYSLVKKVRVFIGIQ